MTPESSPPADGRLRFVPATHDDPLARPLLAELAVEYAQRYGGTPSAHLSWLPVPRDELAPPDAADRRRRRRARHRRRVSPLRRRDRRAQADLDRRGPYARALLAALEERTRACGYRRLYLITGNRQPEAEALYDATGYTRVPPDPLPDWGPFRPIAFEKWLVPDER